MIAYTLCQKPVIGIVMWIVTLCGFRPLFAGEPIVLGSAGTSVTKAISVAVDKKYLLLIKFEFPSAQARLADNIVGGGTYEARMCEGEASAESLAQQDLSQLGRPIPLRVVVRKAGDRSILLERTFISLCNFSHGTASKNRTIGWIHLPRGKYSVEVTNLQAQAGLENVKTGISLVFGDRK